MKLSRGAGICYDLEKSPYKVTVDDFTYHFSSDLHRVKFLERFEDSRSRVSESLSNRFNVYITFNILSDILLYKSIEKRGFYITDVKGRCFKCLNQIKLIGKSAKG